MNRLNDSTSPYLLQHADNPVDWWPWCEEALNMAREQNKPILLSIGYSACHWCHVMAHESFEDQETADVMNALFINIKVDREERPDLDKIYQSAHQLLSQRPGGWPLTVFLSPDDQVPFFAGTYFPKEQRYGMVSFKELMRRIDDAWRGQQAEIRKQNDSLLETFTRLRHADESNQAVLNDAPFDEAFSGLNRLYDLVNGGFGSAPKFPHPTNLEFLLRRWAVDKDNSQPLNIASHTLLRMASGGLNDQIGGGFCRYSVDEKWMIPHFEKMLYDNGPLLALYTDVFLATGNSYFKSVCQSTADWVIREMQSPEGGYYSTLDADSEGEEGKFYVWSRDEVKALLADDEFRLVEKRYGFDRAANFEGQYHLHIYEEMDALEKQLNKDQGELSALLDSAHAKLMAERNKRIRPGRDEKILTSWNALMISGMAHYARLSGDTSVIESAEKALSFLYSTMWNGSRLCATYKDGKAHLNAYLDDYAFLLDALIEMLQLRWDNQNAEFAIQLADVLLEQFEDKAGGFYFTSTDHEKLIQRPKPYSDDAMPSGNGRATQALLRLGYLFGETRYIDAAEKVLKNAWPQIKHFPDGHCALLNALQEYLEPTEIIIMRADESKLAEWQDQLSRSYVPNRLIFSIPSTIETISQLEGKSMQKDGVIYHCKGTICGMPLHDPAQLAAIQAD